METKRTGKCINFGNCAKADRKEIIELDVTEDFVCPECNSDLLEGDDNGGKKGSKKLIIIIAIVATLITLGGGAAAYFFLFDKDADDDLDTYAVEQPREEPKPEVQPVEEITTPAEEPKEEAQPEQPQTVAPKQEQVKPQPTTTITSGTVAVTGGSYTGELKNGKPHGMGTLKYNTRTLISKRDSKGRYAEAGDYITGQFHEGELVMGKLFDRNGEQKEALNIGRAN